MIPHQANVTVYMPDFFGGEMLDAQKIIEGKGRELDIAGFIKRNSRAIREPEIFACAKALRSSGFNKIGTVGYCYGGWAVLRLASESLGQPAVLLLKELENATNSSAVDAAICAHPSLLENSDFDNVKVPVMFLAPEHDEMFSDEMKEYAFKKLVLEKKNVPVEWVHFPDVSHGCLTKGDESVKGEREAMVKAKDRAVTWWREWLV